MIETMVKIDWENTNAVDSTYPQKRENVLARIMLNLVQCGILLPGETSLYCDHFSRYDWNELLQILDESNRQRVTCDSVIS
ncbi:MAG TPA: hypothetical protein G4O15_05310 [Dehalococcoidia bacterium]|nr:hypothetical protein [Dehalococcoidia bacterium]